MKLKQIAKPNVMIAWMVSFVAACWLSASTVDHSIARDFLLLALLLLAMVGVFVTGELSE